jgi:hypothetical protein
MYLEELVLLYSSGHSVGSGRVGLEILSRSERRMNSKAVSMKF